MPSGGGRSIHINFKIAKLINNGIINEHPSQIWLLTIDVFQVVVVGHVITTATCCVVTEVVSVDNEKKPSRPPWEPPQHILGERSFIM